MIKRILSLFLVFVVLTFSLSGCRFIKSDISKMNVILAIGIDGVVDSYNISVRVFEASSTEEAKNAKTAIYSSSGKTVSQAVNGLTSSIGNNPLLSQSSVIIFGKDTAENGVKEIFEYFTADDYIGPSAAVVVSETKASDIIFSDELENFLPTDRFTNMIRAAWENAEGVNTKFAQATVKCENRFSDFTLPVIGFDSAEHIVTKSAAVFKNESLINIIDEDIIKGLLFLSDDIRGGFFDVKDETGVEASFEIIKSSSVIQTDMENGKIILNIEITTQFNIIEFKGGVLSEETVERLNGELSASLKAITEKSYDEVIRKMQSDPVNIGRRLYIDRKISSSITDEEFRKLLSQSEVNVDVKAKIARSGLF